MTYGNASKIKKLPEIIPSNMRMSTLPYNCAFRLDGQQYSTGYNNIT